MARSRSDCSPLSQTIPCRERGDRPTFAGKSGGFDAGLDAGLAAALPQDHRSCGAPSRRPRGGLALGRRADPPHQLPRRCARARCASPSASTRTASASGTAPRRSPGTHWRHLEVWYGLLGIGGVYHTVNPRLFADQIAWIINDAEDRLLFVDLTFLPIVEKLRDRLKSVEKIVVLTDAAHMPETTLDAEPYEEWLAADDDFAWRELRREHRRRHVLHVGHDRQSEGRRLLAPLQRAACADRRTAPTCSRCRAATG